MRISAELAVTALVDVYASTADQALEIATGLDNHCLKDLEWFIQDGPELQVGKLYLERAVDEELLSLVDVSLVEVNDGKLGYGLGEK
jgi:hypothetical protein